MVTFVQGQSGIPLPAIYTRLSPMTNNGPPSIDVVKLPAIDALTAFGGTLTKVDHTPPRAALAFEGKEVLESSGGFAVWFEEFHVLPRKFDLGNVLSAQSIPMQVYLATRRSPETWTSFANNAGSGVTVTGVPVLPSLIDAQTEVQITLGIDTNGDPFVDATFDFVFSTGTTLVPIVLQRIVLWNLRPELPYTELLAFLTDVFEAKSGKEKRHALRKNPRQTFKYKYLVDDADRPIFENRMFDFHARQFGLPVWFDDANVSTAVLAGDLTISVESTAFRDFRVGGLAVLLLPDGTFDVLNITAVTATTLVSDSPTLNAFPVGTEVFPLSTSRLDRTLSGARYPVGLSSLNLNFKSSDNDANLASIAHFANTYKGKPVIESGQIMRGTASESFETRLIVVDSRTGLLEQTSPWDGQRHGRDLIMRSSGREASWNLRQFAHWLRGKQVTFYVPREFPDLIVTADLSVSSASMEIENVEYSQFVRNRTPRNSIRIELTDGSVLFRDITNSVVSGDPTKEGLTVDSVWLSTVTVAQIERVSFIEKVRLDTDNVKLEFDADARTVRFVAPIKSVFE